MIEPLTKRTIYQKIYNNNIDFDDDVAIEFFGTLAIIAYNHELIRNFIIKITHDELD